MLLSSFNKKSDTGEHANKLEDRAVENTLFSKTGRKA